ncbi:MAG TPA: hypothetical protein VND62_08525 [Acidimicrobiales bacterium]|nr:hypothetical protein [Acidimicrobiales bacterium]
MTAATVRRRSVLHRRPGEDHSTWTDSRCQLRLDRVPSPSTPLGTIIASWFSRRTRRRRTTIADLDAPP